MYTVIIVVTIYILEAVLKEEILKLLFGGRGSTNSQRDLRFICCQELRYLFDVFFIRL